MAVHGTFIIKHTVGLHARPATILAKTASEYESQIDVIFHDKKGNAKSLLNILGLGVKKGDEITIRVEGIDEKNAFAAIRDLLNCNFHEL